MTAQKKAETWAQIVEFALGEVGLSAEEFWCMSMAEYILKLRGYIKKNAKTKAGRKVDSLLSCGT